MLEIDNNKLEKTNGHVDDHYEERRHLEDSLYSSGESKDSVRR
jgi:hypothetical protein